MRVECLLVSDLHGSHDRYEKLRRAVLARRPRAVFIGGDILPSGFGLVPPEAGPFVDFVGEYLADLLEDLQQAMGEAYPELFVVLGNDDPRVEEAGLLRLDEMGLLHYVHDNRYRLDDYDVYGYAFIPPSPYRLKDWERYDVSRYADPGCTHPSEGFLSVEVPRHELEHYTMAKGLARLVADSDLSRAVFLFHSPPYDTNLDRAGLDGVKIDHAPLDVHVGSIAVRRLIEARQPLVTLHGHVHESARLTGSWRDRIGRTHLYSAAHDGPELAVIAFDLSDPGQAERELV